MRRLSDSEREELVLQTVKVMDDARIAFLRGGGSPLKQWDMVEARAKSASRRTASVEEWVTALYRGLQLGPPSSSASSGIDSLARIVREWDAADEWFALLDRETTYMIAQARLAVEEKRAKREAEQGLAAVELARMKQRKSVAE